MTGRALLANWLVDGKIQKGNLVELLPSFEASARNLDTAAWIASHRALMSFERCFIDFLKAVGQTEQRNPQAWCKWQQRALHDEVSALALPIAPKHLDHKPRAFHITRAMAHD